MRKTLSEAPAEIRGAEIGGMKARLERGRLSPPHGRQVGGSMSVSQPDEPWLELYDYWIGKHVEGRPPSRKDLDPPLEIPRLVARLMLVDTEGDEFRYRLVGSAIASGMNADMTGKVAGATGWTSPQVAAAWRQMLASVRDGRKPLLVITTLPGEDTARNHCIALPLVNADGGVEQIMVGVYYGGYTRANPIITGLTIHEVAPLAKTSF
jgi:hypothetical protein